MTEIFMTAILSGVAGGMVAYGFGRKGIGVIGTLVVIRILFFPFP